MSGYEADTSKDRVVPASGELDTIWRPRSPRKGKRGVLLLHGQSNPTAYIDAVGQKASMRMAAELAASGIRCIAGEMHGNSWGNDLAMADMLNAWGILKAEYPDLAQDKVLVLGISMGAALAVRFSQLHPFQTAGVVGIIPAYDPKAIYNYSNVGDAAMEAAWGFSGIGNFPTGLDLAASATDASSVPIWSAYASDDALVPASSVTAYHSAVGGEAANITDLGALGHTDAAIAAVSVAAVARFLVANGA